MEQIPRLRRYARTLTRSSELADDLVQDCLERAWSRMHRWEPGSDLRAWLFTIMHNLYVNQVRDSMRRPEPFTADSPAIADPTGEFEPGLTGLRDLEAGLAALPPDYREVLLLVCVEEMSYRQIAEVLGVPIGTVMSRLHRGRERLRQWLDGKTS